MHLSDSIVPAYCTPRDRSCHVLLSKFPVPMTVRSIQAPRMTLPYTFVHHLRVLTYYIILGTSIAIRF